MQVDESCDPGEGQRRLMAAASVTWGCNGLRLCLAVERMVQECLLDVPVILSWALEPVEPGVPRIICDDCHAADAAFDVFHQTLTAAASHGEVRPAYPQHRSTLSCILFDDEYRQFVRQRVFGLWKIFPSC